MKQSAKDGRRPSGTDRALRQTLRRLAGACRDPAHVIELYYWSGEPALIGILRRYIALPNEPRDALCAFLTMTADCPESVQVTVNREGQVTLSSPAVTSLMLGSATSRPKRDNTEAVH